MECFLDDTFSIPSHAFLWEGSEEGSGLSAAAGALLRHAQSCLQMWGPGLCPQPGGSMLDAPPGGCATGTQLCPCLCRQSAKPASRIWPMPWFFRFLPWELSWYLSLFPVDG